MNFLAKALETVQHVVEENQQKQQNYSNNNNQQQQQYGQQSQQQQQQQAANGIFHPQRAHQASFNPNAKYRALFIGINYFGTKSELRGCLNDVKNVSNWLHAAYPMFSQQTLVLTDDQTNNPAYLPTRANILNALNWLVADARPGDCFFLHYSGHGGQARDTSGDEKDGMDSTICPMDYSTAGQITDDELHSILFGRMPRGSKLTA